MDVRSPLCQSFVSRSLNQFALAQRLCRTRSVAHTHELSVGLTITLSVSHHCVCSSGCLTLCLSLCRSVCRSVCRSIYPVTVATSLNTNRLSHAVCHSHCLSVNNTHSVRRSATHSLQSNRSGHLTRPEAAHFEAAGVARPPTKPRGRTCRHETSVSAQTNASSHLDSVH